MDIVTFMTEQLLSFADDIVPVDKQDVIDFFKSQNAPYRDDHVEFLTRFGGNNFTAFLRQQNVNFSFSAIKHIYKEDEYFPDDIELKGGCCHFAVPDFDNPCCIEQSTGIIYREEVDETGNPVLNEIVWCDIKSFLFMASLYYLENIAIEISLDKNLTDEYVSDFQKENQRHKIPACSYSMEYYLKEDLFYCFSPSRNYLFTYKLYAEHYEKLEHYQNNSA